MTSITRTDLVRRCAAPLTLLTLLLAALLALAGPAVADTTACPPPAAPPTVSQQAALQRDARDRGLLWRITKEGRTSWLYGTLHVGRLDWTVPGVVVRDALRSSDVLAVELDASDPGILTRLQVGMARDPRLTMTPELDRRLADQLARACMPPEAARQIAPEMLGAALTLAALRPAGLEAVYGLDLTLIRTAQGLGKPVHSLESVDLQLAGLLSDNEPALRANMDALLGALEQGQVRPIVERLADAWEAGRDDMLANYADWCQCADTPAERARLERLVTGRNPGLADGIERLQQGGQRVFVAVGSLHLVGPEGLPALFAARGYTVTREPLPR